MRKLLSIAVIVPVLLATSPLGLAQDKAPGQDQAQPPPQYTPQAVFCADPKTPNVLCSLLAAYIGPDPILRNKPGYNGLRGDPPKDSNGDVETPFDNMAWQMFVALNWAKDVSGKAPPAQGLAGQGLRVWQTYAKVSAVFGNSPVRGHCTNALAIPTFYIGSDGNGKPAPNNEEYFQASTNLPLVDVNGNWTIFERRVNDVDAKYLRAPDGDASQTLTTVAGQKKFVANHMPNPDGSVQFTASATVPNGANGSIEIKAAWRIIDRNAGDDPSRYYTMPAQIAVAGDLVRGGRSFCRSALVGLVGMHIIQRNPDFATNGALHPQWIWATFEHVDNAPDAQAPCSVRDGCGLPNPSVWINQPSCGAAAPSQTTRYSYFRQNASVTDTNIRPKTPGSGPTTYPWNSKPPYAQGGTTPATMLPQATRCWSIYPTTDQLNAQWQKALGAAGSVFSNYKLIGTQWGATLEGLPPPPVPNPVPTNAVPGMLSNLTLETYIQNYNGTDTDPKAPGPGSCVACHSGAPLIATYKDKNGKEQTVKSDFSFLPLLAKPDKARNVVNSAKP